MKERIILEGPAAAGKTELAKLLAERFRFQGQTTVVTGDLPQIRALWRKTHALFSYQKPSPIRYAFNSILNSAVEQKIIRDQIKMVADNNKGKLPVVLQERGCGTAFAYHGLWKSKFGVRRVEELMKITNQSLSPDGAVTLLMNVNPDILRLRRENLTSRHIDYAEYDYCSVRQGFLYLAEKNSWVILSLETEKDYEKLFNEVLCLL